MAKKKLLTLAKELDFTQDYEYFDYCIDSHFNGNRTQCRKLFAAMKQEDKKELIKYIDSNFPKKSRCDDIKEFYFNLL
jgi:hypothetical protein